MMHDVYSSSVMAVSICSVSRQQISYGSDQTCFIIPMYGQMPCLPFESVRSVNSAGRPFIEQIECIFHAIDANGSINDDSKIRPGPGAEI